MKKNKGITLIALVITIIVLLILAGVAIAMLSGENGILKKAAEAKTKTEEGQEQEKERLATMELETYFLTNNLKYKCSNGYITGFTAGEEKVEKFEEILKPIGYKVTSKYEYNMSTHTGEYIPINESEKKDMIMATGMIVEKDDNKLSTVVFGDFNCDGKVDATDRSYFLAYCGGLTLKLAAPMKISIDMNCDGKINATDKDLLIKYVSGDVQIKQQQYAQDPSKIEEDKESLK